MKGIVDVEFLISAFLFIVVISFVTLTIAGTIPVLHNSIVKDSSAAQAWQISEELMIDGEPDKAAINALCSNYAQTRDEYTESFNDIIVSMEGIPGGECGPGQNLATSLVARKSIVKRTVLDVTPKTMEVTFIPGR